jgi:hypothetical protein
MDNPRCVSLTLEHIHRARPRGSSDDNINEAADMLASEVAFRIVKNRSFCRSPQGRIHGGRESNLRRKACPVTHTACSNVESLKSWKRSGLLQRFSGALNFPRLVQVLTRISKYSGRDAGGKVMRMRNYVRCCACVTTLVVLSGCGGGGGGGYGGNNPPAMAAPTVALSAPSSSSVNRTVALTATATAPAGVTRVEFLVDGTVIATDTTAPYTADWDTSAVADGAHNVTARVTDAGNTAVSSSTVAFTVTNSLTIDVELGAVQVFPKTDSTANGTGQLTFNVVSGAVSGGVTLSGVTATIAHIHRGIAGTNGPVIVDLVQSGTDANRWDVISGGTLTADQVDALLAGELYVNVHSAAHPGGEIRGQIKPQGIDVAFASLSGANVVPAATNTAAGLAAMTVNSTSSTATVQLMASGVDDATEAHVHSAPAGQNASGPLLTLTKDATTPGHWSLEQQSVTQADRTALASDGLYVDLHTPGAPNGALRGQLSLTAAESTPPPPTVTLAELQQTIFTPICSGCHTGGGANLPASMNLSNAAATYASLVGVASAEQPSSQRVSAGNPDTSYLVHKLEGASGIVGSRMPLGGAALDPTLIANVRAWITAGALNN